MENCEMEQEQIQEVHEFVLGYIELVVPEGYLDDSVQCTVGNQEMSGKEM